METEKVEITSSGAPAPTVAVIEAPPSAEMLRMAEEAGRAQAELAELRMKLSTQESELAALRSEIQTAQAQSSAAMAAAATAVEATTEEETEEEEETESGEEITEVEIPPQSSVAEAGRSEVETSPSPVRERGLMCRMFLGKSV